MFPNDTIAAIATAPGKAGLAVVRMSGAEALTFADQVFQGGKRSPSEMEGGTFLYGYIVDAHGSHIDEAIVLIFKEPRSFTCENLVEFQVHGGNQCARRVLRRLFEIGVRPAEPGEFTKRAFLNGRIDLLQAEAVLDLVHAYTERATAAAMEQLEGTFSKIFENIYNRILNETSTLEVLLDFPEEEIPKAIIENTSCLLSDCYKYILSILDSWDEGRILRDGALVVISGKPNVGKSTLLNKMLESERAIVSNKPGTTRDVIEVDINIKGIPIRLIDTAGLHSATCDIEKEGIRRTRFARKRSDLHLYMIDASQCIDEETRQHILEMEPENSIIINNKIDLGRFANLSPYSEYLSLDTSLLKEGNIEEIKNKIFNLLEKKINLSSQPHAVISERHKNLLLKAGKELKKGIALLNKNDESTFVLIASHLRTSLENLGEITGKVYHEQLLDNIFNRFCIGK